MAGMLSRLFNRWRRKESRTARLLVSQAGGGAICPDKDYENYSKETYLKNVISFACIKMIAQDASLPRWELNRRLPDDKSEKVTDHPWNELLRRPNPRQSWNYLTFRAIAFLVLSGNSFLERVKLEAAEYPSEMYSLRPDRVKMKMNTKTGQIASYTYTAGIAGVEFEVDPITQQSDLLHLMLFHPTNDFFGASPIEPASRIIDSNNEAIDWNQSLLRNQGRPGMVFTLVGEVSDDEFDRFTRHLDEEFSGKDNVGKNLTLTGEKGTQAKPYSLTPTEMEFIEGNRELARGIALAFGIPPLLMGIPGDSTYNNYKEARLALYEDTTSFYLKLYRSELNNWSFTEEDGLFLSYNEDDLPALEPRQETKWKRAQDADFLTINEKRKLTGYEDRGDEGDVILVDANKIPLSMAVTSEIDENSKMVALSSDERNLIAGMRNINWSDEE